MRTDEEILARIDAVKDNDWLGTEMTDLLVCLPFDAAKPHLNGDAIPGDWKVAPRDRDAVLARMLDYMPFAWDKANNQRGLSAGRSMSHFSAWTWLIEEDFGDLHDYVFYGKPHLVAICERFGWNHAQWDDGERSNG